MTRDLQARGLSLDVVDDIGNTILHEATKDPRGWSHQPKELLRGLEALLALGLLGPRRGMSVNLTSTKNHAGQNALHCAAAVVLDRPFSHGGGDSDEVDAAFFDILLSNGFEKDSRDASGATPLYLAAGVSEIRTWKLLVAGADITIASGDGSIPLHNAARRGKANCVSFLCREHLRRGIPLDVKNSNGDTPLHEAARSGNPLVAKFLLQAGADGNAVNLAGESPLQVAESMTSSVLHAEESARIVEYVVRIAGDSEKSSRTWRMDDGEGDFKRPPLDTVVEALDTPDYAATARAIRGVSKDPAGVPDAGADGPVVIPHRPHRLGGQNVGGGEGEEGHGAEQLALTGALLGAILSRKYDNLPSLVSRGADAASPIFENHESLLHILVRAGAADALEALLPLIEDITVLQPPLLHIAAERKESNIACIQHLLSLGADPNMDCQESKRPIRISRFPMSLYGKHNAMHVLAHGVFSWHADALGLLVARGGDLKRQDARLRDCLQLCEANERHGTKPGPYGSLCKEAILAVYPPESPKEDAAEDFLHLINDGDIEGVRALLDAGADPNAVYVHDDASMIPLEACATFWDDGYVEREGGDESIPEIMTLLLQAGADPYHTVAGGYTPAFHFVCERNGPVAPFVDAGVDLDKRDAGGATPLIASAGWYGYVPQGGRDHAGCDLVAAGADVQAADGEGRTALHAAAVCESHLTNPQLMYALLSAGARADAKDGEGHDPFYYFLRTNGADMEHYKVSTLGEMFSAGVDPLDADAETGETNLHALMDVLATELGEGRGHDSLSLADIWDGLVAGGADGEARDGEGRTPLFRFVAALGHRAVPATPGWEWCKGFLGRRDVAAVSVAGDTVLHVLARQPRHRGSWELDDKATLFRMLMELGADPRRENAEGMSAVDIAAAHADGPILAIFEESQA